MFLCIFNVNAQNKVRLTDDEYSVLRKDVVENYAEHPLDAVSRASEYLATYADQFTPQQHLKMFYAKAFYQIAAELYDDAHRTLIKCKTMADELNEPELSYYFHDYMALVLLETENFELAIGSYLDALEVAKQTDDGGMIARAHNNVGHILTLLEQYERAKPYIEFFYEYGKTHTVWTYIATGLNNLGEIALANNNIDTAKQYFEQSLDIRKAQNYPLRSSWSYHNLGLVHFKLGEYQQAAAYLNQAIAIRAKYQRETEMIRSSLALVEAYFALEQDQQAYDLLLTSIEQLKVKNQQSLLASAYQMLKRYYQQQQNTLGELSVTEDLLATQLALSGRKFDLALTHYLAKVEINIQAMDNQALRKENELAQQKVDSKQTQLLIIVVMSGLIFLVVISFVRSLKAKNSKLKATINTLDQTRIELIEAEKMSAITTLVSGMAHQLNTPIGIVTTANSVVQEKLNALSARVKARSLNQKSFDQTLVDIDTSLNLSENNCQKAADLIEQFKHISAELEGAEVSRFAVKAFLQKKLQLITSQYPNIQSVEVLGPELNVEQYANVLFKVLEQLVKNTAENAPQSSQALSISVVIESGANGITLTYRDNGSGIADEIRDKVFEPFFTTKGMQQSMGLGLNIAYNSVHHLMQGKLCCEPSSRGAKFTLQLPFTFTAQTSQ